MKVTNPSASTPIAFIFVGGVGLGLAYGLVRAIHLSLIASILSMVVILLLLMLIFRKGKGAAHAEAQAWAQSTVDVAVEVYNKATAKAEAISEAYSIALSQANATAQNSVVFQLPESVLRSVEAISSDTKARPGELENPLILPESLIQQVKESVASNGRDDQSSRMAMEQLSAQESETVRQETDTQAGSPTSIL